MCHHVMHELSCIMSIYESVVLFSIPVWLRVYVQQWRSLKELWHVQMPFNCVMCSPTCSVFADTHNVIAHTYTHITLHLHNSLHRWRFMLSVKFMHNMMNREK